MTIVAGSVGLYAFSDIKGPIKVRKIYAPADVSAALMKQQSTRDLVLTPSAVQSSAIEEADQEWAARGFIRNALEIDEQILPKCSKRFTV